MFIPYNTLKEADETTTKLTLDDKEILLKTKVPITIESDKELIADVKEVHYVDADTLVMFNAKDRLSELENFYRKCCKSTYTPY